MEEQIRIKERLLLIEESLAAGVEFVSTDSTQTRVNLSELRREWDRLYRRLATHKMQRPVASGIRFNGFRG